MAAGRTVTYGRIVEKIRPKKAETHRTRLTVGGNLINFPSYVTTTTSDLITAKLIFNIVFQQKMQNSCVQTYAHSILTIPRTYMSI